uniref:Probable GPI-anchored adhesin-like protein PGA55-like n=1 Tax=Saccoglossus kowalevskii TaxID=10224 RepID=A0ABM0GUC0_SACKO|nr:PREDICTED: probable GPI-anchored adhesin-like protein PGA55-like [Saccoglossus kowalevskii]
MGAKLQEHVHFDLGPSLLDDVLSAWDFSKSTLDSNFGSSSTGSPPKDSKFNSPSTESPRKDSKFNFPSSGSPPKRESSFKLDSPPKSNNPQKTVETSVLSKSLSPEVIPKHVVNPIKKPKRSFRTERPKKNYIKQLKESPLSSPEVEIVSLPGKDERNKTGDIIERASSISTSTSLKTDVIVDSAVAKDVTSSLEFDKFRKRDSDTESTDRDYLQLMESTSGHAESLPVESVPKPAESTSGLAESFETKERQSSCDISDDNLNETPVFQRSLSKKDAISDRGLEAYEALVGSSVNVKKSSKAPSSQSRVVSPSKGIPVIRSVSQRGSVSPSHAPNSWSSSQSGTVSPSHAPYIRSSSHTDAVSPSYAPNSWGSSLSGVSSPTANSVFSVSRQSSITSPTKSECDLQYADLLHDTSGEDTIDLSQPVSTEPALSPTSPSNSFYAVATTTEERRDPVSSTTCRTSVGRNKNASSVVGNFYAQIYEKPEAASSQRKASSSEEDLDRDDASRRSARDIIKRFENKSQPLSVKMESHSPKKQAISNLKDLFTIDTNNEQKPPDKEPAPPVLSPRKISLPTRLNTADNLEQDDDKLEVALSETTLKHLQRSTRRTRRPIGEARCKRRSSGDASESGTDSREEVATLAYGDKERRKKEQQQKYARQKSTEEVMKTRPLPDLPVDVDKNPSHVMHDYEMISIPAVPPRMPLNPQWPKKRRSRKSSKSQSGKSSPTKSSSSASSLLYSESDPGTPDTPVSSQSASSPFLSTSPITNSELRTKFLHQKSASLDITSDSDVVRSSPEEIRRHLKKDKENYQNIKSNQKTLSLDRKVLTRSHTNPSLQNMDSKSEFRTRSQTTTDIHGQSLQVVNDGVPKRCKSYEDELDDILDGALGPAESLNDVLKRTYKLKDGQDISSSHSEVSSVTSNRICGKIIC